MLGTWMVWCVCVCAPYFRLQRKCGKRFLIDSKIQFGLIHEFTTKIYCTILCLMKIYRYFRNARCTSCHLFVRACFFWFFSLSRVLSPPITLLYCFQFTHKDIFLNYNKIHSFRIHYILFVQKLLFLWDAHTPQINVIYAYSMLVFFLPLYFVFDFRKYIREIL